MCIMSYTFLLCFKQKNDDEADEVSAVADIPARRNRAVDSSGRSV